MAAEPKKTCSTCKHWTRPDKIQPKSLPLGTCKAIPHQSKFDDRPMPLVVAAEKLDAMELFNEELKKLVEETRAAVDDGSAYFAVFMPRADFGCVLHQEKARGR